MSHVNSLSSRLALLGLVVAALCGGLSTAVAQDTAQDEAGIKETIEARRLAWNASDTETYKNLLTPEAELISATGKNAMGRDEIITLYVDQRKGVYRDAELTSTIVTRIKFLTADVATVEADYVMIGAVNSKGEAVPTIEGKNSYVMVRHSGKWLIDSLRGVPKTKFN